MQDISSASLRRLNQLLCEIDGEYHEYSLKLGVSDSVSRILYAICNVGDSCLLSEINRQTGLSKQTVNSALRRLEADGIVYLEAVDGKAKNVCLTERGKEFAAGTAMRIIGVENEIFSSWDERDVEAYINLTERFLLSLKEKFAEL